MSNAIKEAVLQKKVEGEVCDLMVRTGKDNVIVDDTTGKTLATELTEIIALVANKASLGDIDTKIAALIDGAPEAYDTLKELADYIATNETVMTALNAAIGNKVDKVTGKGLSQEDFTTTLKTKLEGITGYTHPTNHPAAMITQDTTHKFVTDAEKATWNAKGSIRSGSSTPADLTDNDLFIQLL